MKVADLMRREPRTVAPRDTLAAAGMLMAEVDCGFLPVVEAGRLVGVLTDRDVCLSLARQERTASQVEVRRAMSDNVLTCRPENDVADALATMRESRVRRLPVLGPERKLVAILSLDDVVVAVRPEGEAGSSAPTGREVLETLRAINEHLVPAGRG